MHIREKEESFSLPLQNVLIIAFWQDNGKVGDTFMNNIQDVATRVPYMTAIGNHEHI